MARKEPAASQETRTKRTERSQKEDRRWLCLVISSGGGVSIVPVPAGLEVVLGRSPEADVVIDDESVSRRHACLHLGEAMELEDLGSRNGTVVDGQTVQKSARAAIRVGSCLELGATTLVIQRALSFLGQEAKKKPSAVAAVEHIVRDPAMQRLYALLDVIGPSPLSVLIVGETGVGKEVFARALHERSPRKGQPFVALNCAALPDALLESELFGFEKGAFTGAVQPKVGFFEAADGGTLFLDEIGEMPAATQAKLLRVIETGEVTRLGSVKPRRVDVRIVCATNRDLRSLSAEGRFRQDLYFRINGATLVIPPLRKRTVEIGPLARLFAERMARTWAKPAPVFGPAVIEALERYEWPGNVRELRNVVERATVVAGAEEIGVEHLELPAPTGDVARASSVGSATMPPPPGGAGAGGLREQVELLERESIALALERTGGNQVQAAKLLGISRGALLKRLAAYGLMKTKP